ncbi:MAG TPA: iron-containing alcohol dehydrogenase [Urbifossiella sp.]|jgi:alcohol dehydrogenase class IV
MRTTWTFHSAGSLVFGRNAAVQLGDIARRLPVGRLFIVTDAMLESVGVVERVIGPLREAGLTIEIFAGGKAEPSLKLVNECAAKARAFGPDCLVGLGGGSNMDVAKLTAVLLAHGGEARDYLGDDRIPGPIMPVICVSTTAGTGSEVSGAAAFTDTDNGVKVGCLSNQLRPRVAVVDPLLTVSCPPKVTADSGIDALTHAIEAFTAVDNAEFPLPADERSVYQGKHPMGDLCAEKAIRLCGQHLRRAVSHAEDLDAREGMALAATLAGLAFSNVGVALVHALEYPVGGATNCSHGEGNGLLLPHVMRFNLPARRREFAKVAEWLCEDTSGIGERDAAILAIAAVERLQTDISIPRRLRDLGVREEQLPDFAAKAAAIKRIIRVNPRPVSAADCEAIYRAAL